MPSRPACKPSPLLVLGCLVLSPLLWLPSTGAQEKEAESPPPTTQTKPFRGRLPAYYGKVVDQQQRAKIYEIQKEYAPRISALQDQLAALMKERNDKVRAVLTPEQQQQVDQFRAAAAAKRREKQAARSKRPSKTVPAESGKATD